MREGKNREIRNVLGHLGLAVNRLIRVSFGPFVLGDLAAGAVEEVNTRHLREQLGERVARRAGADFSTPLIPPPKGEGGGRRPPGGGDGEPWRERPPTQSASPTTLPRKRGREREAQPVGFGDHRRIKSGAALPRKRGREKEEAQALMRIVGGRLRGRRLQPEVTGHPADRRPPARVPVQYPCPWP